MARGDQRFKLAYEIIAVDRFSGTMKQAVKASADVDRALRAVGRTGALMVGAGTALGGSLVYATHQAALFEREMSAVKAVSEAQGVQFDRLSAKAREMGEKTSFSAHEAAEGLKYLALAGWDTEEMLAGIEPVLYLAEAGNMELGRAADLASDSMAGLGIKAEDTEYYLDRIAQTSRNSNTDINMLMEAFKIGGGTLSSLNVPLEESASLFGIMANRGYKGAQAGRAMNAIVQNLTTGFGRAGKAMGEIGVSAFDADGNFRGLEATFRDIIKATKDMNEEDRNRIYAMIAGKEHIKTFMAIVNGLGEEYDDLKFKNINSTGALVEMRNEMKNNLLGAIERLVSAFKELAISTGEVLLPAITGIVEGMINGITALNGMSESSKKVAILATAIGSAFLVLQGTLMTVVSWLSRAVIAFRSLGVGIASVTAIGGVFGAVLGGIAIKGFQMYQEESAKALDATVDFGDEVSDTTAEAVDSYVMMADKVAEATRMYADGQIAVNEEVHNELTKGQEEFYETSMANLQHRQNSEKERTQEHLADIEGMTAEQQQEILNNVDKHYEDQQQALEKSNERINEIYAKAREEKRAVTQEELAEIEQMRAQSQENVISAISKSLEEQQAITEAFASKESEISAEQAARAVERSIERKEGIVQAAEEEFEEKVAWARYMAEEVGAITDEEAQQIIEKAEEKKEEEIRIAEEAHERILESARERAGEHVDLVDWETGEILTGWDLFVARLMGIFEDIADQFEIVKDVLMDFKDTALDMWDGLVEGAQDLLVTLEPVGEIARTMWDGTVEVLGVVVATVQNLAQVFMHLWDNLMSFVTTIAPPILAMFGVLVDALMALWDSFKSIIDKLSELWEKHGETITTVWDAIVAVFTWATRVVLEVVKVAFFLVVTVITGVMQSIMGIIESALDVIIGIFEIFAGIFTGDWARMWEGVGQLVRGAFMLIVNLAMTFIGGGLLRVLKGAGVAIMRGIGPIISRTIGAVTKGIPKMLKEAKEFFKGLPKAIIDEGPKTLKELGKWLLKMVEEVGKLAGKFLNAGKDVINGFMKGFNAVKDKAVEMVTGFADNVISGFKGLLGIKSPSRVFKEFGKNTVEGYVIGFDKESPQAIKASMKLAEELVAIGKEYGESEKDLLDKQLWERQDLREKYHQDIKKINDHANKVGIKATAWREYEINRITRENEMARKEMLKKQAKERADLLSDMNDRVLENQKKFIQKQQDLGNMTRADAIDFWLDELWKNTKNADMFYKIQDERNSILESLRKDMLDNTEDYISKVKDLDSKLLEDTKKATEELEKNYQNRYDSLRNFKGLFDEFKFEDVKGSDLVDNLHMQVAALQEFDRTMSQLEKKLGGKNKALIEELRGMGAGSVNELRAINSLTEEELDHYVWLFETRDKWAKHRADKEFAPIREEHNNTIQQMVKDAEKDLKELEKEWIQSLRDLNRQTSKEMDSTRAIGRDAVQGLIDGMWSMESRLANAAKHMAHTISDTIKHELNIQSPSRVLRGLGEFAGEGLAIGMERTVGAVARASEMLAVNAQPDIAEIEYEVVVTNGLDNLPTIEGGRYMIALDDADLIYKLEELKEAIEESGDRRGVEGRGTTINVTIDGRTVETMNHVEDFFKEIEQEVKKRKGER